MSRFDENAYRAFVFDITSDTSKKTTDLVNRIYELEVHNKEPHIHRDIGPASINLVPHLLTGALGLGGEAGEVLDHVKKVIFHNKDLTDERRLDIMKELGDVFWYFLQLCIALEINFSDIVEMNEKKLLARHEGTEFKGDYKT
jgi:NTP pyrophosphatase (non-canonical NTP hydrolase)